MAAPIVYRWDDANAPVARGERRSMCDILYACLVTGYGAKPGAGWTREFVNATFDKAVFRNNPATGTGFYLVIDGATAVYANAANVRAYESMSDIDTGLFPFRTSWTAYDVIGNSSSAGTTARPWVLIADDRFFYFICWPNITGTSIPADNQTVVAMMFFGDIVSRHAADPYGCVLGSYSVQSYFGFYVTIYGPDITTGNYWMPRAISGVATPINVALVRGGGPGALSIPGQQGVLYTAGGPLFVARPHINEAAAYTFRGWLPGFYYPCHPVAFGNFQQVSADGKNFLSFRNPQYNQNSNIFISLDDWRA